MGLKYTIQAQKLPEKVNGEDLMKRLDEFWKHLSFACNIVARDQTLARIHGADSVADRLLDRLNSYGIIRLVLCDFLSDYYVEEDIRDPDQEEDFYFVEEVDYHNLPR